LEARTIVHRWEIDMADVVLLRRVRLTPHHASTGKTRHFRGGIALSLPAELTIVKYPNDPGYYLLHFDEAGQEMTDTYHENLASAIEQAEWEFNIRPEDWEVVLQSV
jgi:hypothetical protein